MWEDFLAVDKQTLLSRVLQGLGKPGLTEIPTVYPNFYGYASGYSPRAFDIAAANAKLDSAGYAKGADGNRTDKSGKPLTRYVPELKFPEGRYILDGEIAHHREGRSAAIRIST